MFTYTLTLQALGNKKSIFDGDTSGTWVTNTWYWSSNVLMFDMGTAESNYRPSNCGMLVVLEGADGAVQLITQQMVLIGMSLGVQLEIGNTATSFEHRTYPDELARCQRYYYQD